MALSFKEHLKKRNEAFDFLKKMIGKGGDTGDKTSLDAQLTKKAGAAGAGAAGAAGGLIGNTMKVATNIATGNVIGTAVSVWSWLDGVIKGGSALKTLSRMGNQVTKVQDHKVKLGRYLEEKRIQPASAKKIINAIFEIDPNDVEHVSQPLWASAVVAFLEVLDTGYDNIQQKVFTNILYQKLLEQVQKAGSNAARLDKDIQELMTHLQAETQKNTVVLSPPQIQNTIAQFHPEEEHAQEPAKQPEPLFGSPPGYNDDPPHEVPNLFGEPPGTEERKKKKSWWGGKKEKPKAPTTHEEWDALPEKKGHYNDGEVIYKKDYTGKIIPGIVFHHNENGLYTYYQGERQVLGDNPESVRGVGEKIQDMNGSLLYRDVVYLLQHGHQHGLDYWARTQGIRIHREED